MAKNMLPVDFRDDILSESMNNRRRYQMINNSDGTVSFVDVTEYEQVGSVFGQAQINAICAAVNGLTDSVSDAFSEEKNYEVGDYAIYENILYRFTAEKTAGAWNPAAAEAVTVAGELDKLNGNLTALSDKMVDSIVVRTVMWSGVVQAGGAGRPSVVVPTVKGYTPIAAIPQDLAAWFFYSRCSLSGNTWNATICSTYEDGQPHSLTAYACILYVKNS